MFSRSSCGSVTFDALVVSVGPDYPIRIVSWKYDGKTEAEHAAFLYRPEDSLFDQCSRANPGIDEEEADYIMRTCHWISEHIGDFINSADDQSHLLDEDLWDAGVFACRIKLNGFYESSWDGEEYDEEHEFIKIVEVSHMIDWDKDLDLVPDLTQKG